MYLLESLKKEESNILNKQPTKPLITVFTPTYNRGATINKCYESLLRQDSRDFKWLVVDDGSTDRTKGIIQAYIEEDKIPITYVYKKNGGVHTAHNTAYQMIDTELAFLCDSDDYLDDKAISIISDLWKEKRDEKYSALIGLDAVEGGGIITKLPEDINEVTLYDIRYKYNIRGDFKIIFRSDILKEELFPEIEGEKYFPLTYKYFKIDKEYKMIPVNEVLCHIEYLPDGISLNRVRLYNKAPKGYVKYRLLMMGMAPNVLLRFKEAVHYISSCVIAGQYHFFKDNRYILETLCAIPFGFLLSRYVKHYAKKK